MPTIILTSASVVSPFITAHIPAFSSFSLKFSHLVLVALYKIQRLSFAGYYLDAFNRSLFPFLRLYKVRCNNRFGIKIAQSVNYLCRKNCEPKSSPSSESLYKRVLVSLINAIIIPSILHQRSSIIGITVSGYCGSVLQSCIRKSKPDTGRSSG